MNEQITANYQTINRDCQLRWDILNPQHYIVDKVVLDIGCAQGWFVEKSLENGAKKVIGIDIADYNWKDNCYGWMCREGGEYHVSSDKLFNINSEINTIFLLSVDTDINIVDKIFKSAGNIETIYFEPYLDSEHKSKWLEDEWLQRFREIGYDFYKLGISDRDRSLYLLRKTVQA